METGIGSVRREVRALLKLGAPVVAVQLGMFGMNIVDTMMVGHLEVADGGAGALACVGVGGLYHWMCTVFWFGTLMAVDPVVSQAYGAKDVVAMTRGLQRGLILAAMMTLPAMLLALPAAPMLELFGQPPSVIPRASLYAWINAAGTLPFLVFSVSRQLLQAQHRVRSLVLAIVAANVLNVFLDWGMIYGKAGFPAMGVAGAAWATVISRFALVGLLFAFEWRSIVPHLSPWHRVSFAVAPLLRMLRLGVPMGVQFLLEYGVFGIALLILGRISVTAQEGHQVAINLASASFMVPLGLSAAAGIRVGNAVGRGDSAGVRRAAGVALVTAVVVMAGFGAVFLLLPAALARIYSDVPEVVEMAATLLPIAGFFQIFDGLQVVAIGILRGLGDTTAPAIINIVGFWALGLPLSYWLAFGLDGGPAGIWWGFVLGLGSVAALLLLRIRHRLSRDVARFTVEGASP